MVFLMPHAVLGADGAVGTQTHTRLPHRGYILVCVARQYTSQRRPGDFIYEGGIKDRKEEETQAQSLLSEKVSGFGGAARRQESWNEGARQRESGGR